MLRFCNSFLSIIASLQNCSTGFWFCLVCVFSGTPNNPTFEMACIIMDQSFVGTGRSKKDAKLEASQVALKQLFGKDFSTNEAKSETSIEENAQLSVAVNNLNCQEIDSWMELEVGDEFGVSFKIVVCHLYQVIIEYYVQKGKTLSIH